MFMTHTMMAIVFYEYDDDGIGWVRCTVDVHSEVSLTDGDHKPAMPHTKHKHMSLCII